MTYPFLPITFSLFLSFTIRILIIRFVCCEYGQKILSCYCKNFLVTEYKIVLELYICLIARQTCDDSYNVLDIVYSKLYII